MALGDRGAMSLADVPTHARPERCRPTGRSVLSVKNGRRSECAVRRTEGPVGRPRSAEYKVRPWAGPEAAREPAPGRTGKPRRDHRAGPTRGARRGQARPKQSAGLRRRQRRPQSPRPGTGRPLCRSPSSPVRSVRRPGAPRHPSQGARGRPRGPGGSRPGVTRRTPGHRGAFQPAAPGVARDHRRSGMSARLFASTTETPGRPRPEACGHLPPERRTARLPDPRHPAAPPNDF